MEKLFIIGYMGAGKTTLGRALAKIERLEFIDLDLFIESKYQKSIARLFEEYGETGFREIESAALKDVADFENIIVSTGGGTPCFFDNMALMNAKGTTIYLKVSPERLAKRLNKHKDKRPLIKNKSEIELLDFVSVTLSKRELFYNRASVIFETEEFESKEEIPQCIEKLRKILNINKKEL
ncbi:shikimate kinase [Viscerimonas tarda]